MGNMTRRTGPGTALPPNSAFDASSFPARVSIGSRVAIGVGEESHLELTGKSAALFAIAALDGRVERRRLALMLWPESAESQARNNLRTLVHRLNQRAGGELLVGAEYLSIDRDRASVVLQDNDALLAQLSRGGAERSELLAESDVEADTSSALGEWLEAARERLRRIQLAGLSVGLAKAMALAAGDHMQAERAVALARACVQLEPLSEHWHRQLMDTLSRCGDREAALVAYEECKARLMEELGVQPDVQTRTVHLRMLQGQAHAHPVATAITAGLTPLEGAARFPLVEREAVLGEVQAALARGLHVAVHGEAGVGKTRLLRQLEQRSDVEQLSIRSGARQEPYAALAQLLQEVQPRRSPRVGNSEQIELARLAPLAFAEVKPSEASLSAPRLHAALKHWAGRLREAGVNLLVLDDVHEADAASQAALSALIAEQGEGLPLLLGYRSAEIEEGLSQTLLDAQGAGRARCIALPRLTLQGVRALLQAVDSEQRVRQPDALAAQLLQRTGGNPLFVIELAQHALERGDDGIGGGASLAALLRLRLGRCSALAQQLACLAPVAAEDFTVELASTVTGQPPLALMHAWTELQHRGLFADHGLAHDLVRDAVLGELPLPIGRMLHRQVAAHLEGLGIKGSRVLRHWVAGEDFDRALAHAVHQVHATSAAGLPTEKLHLPLVGIMEKLSDQVLLDNLWVSAELRGFPQTDRSPPEVWPRMVKLVERVRRLGQQARTATWEAFETSRVHFFYERRVRDAYVTLSPAVGALPSPGIERVRAELMLVIYSFALHGGPREHVQRARDALIGLPHTLDGRRARGSVELVSAVFLDPPGTIAAISTRMRAARRRGDRGGATEARARIAEIHLMLGNHVRAHRHFEQLWKWRPGAVDSVEHNTSLALVGLAALGAGRFDEALWHFENAKDRTNELDVYLALLHSRLGQWDSAEAALARATDPAVFNRQAPSFHFAAIVAAELDSRSGKDPLPGLRGAVATMESQGIAGAKLQLMSWEVTRRTGSTAERMAEGEALLNTLKSQSQSRRWLPVLIDLAEAHAQAGSAAARALALEAANALRRGYTAVPVYVPRCLVRCAKLLQASDPSEAESLMHVARRWVVQALPDVPEHARTSFVEEIAVNRLLLVA